MYNTEQYLHRCIDSILAQTFTDFELILVDDGSTDESGKICDEYAANDERVRVIRQTNQGQAAARNEAIHIACGKYISFVDSDDIMHEQCLESLFKAISDCMNAISVCNALEAEQCPPSFFEQVNTVAFRRLNTNEDTLLGLYGISYCCGTVWGKLIPISVVRSHLFTAGRVYEDNAVVVKWLCEVPTVYISDTPLYFYQINKNGTTKGEIDKKKSFDSFWAIEQQINFFKRKNYQRLLQRTINELLVVCAYRYHLTHEINPMLSAEIRKYGKTKWREFKNQLSLEEKEENYILEMLHPRTMAAYCFLNKHFLHLQRLFKDYTNE